VLFFGLGALITLAISPGGERTVTKCLTVVKFPWTSGFHIAKRGELFIEIQTADARRLIDKGLAMPDVEKDDPEIKRRGRETLAKLQ
jgi:hypothetical protein